MVKKKRFELRQVCTHEALIKRNNYYECVICGECFKFENIDFNTFLLECLDDRHYLFVMASDIISEIAMNDEDIFDVFEDTSILETFLSAFIVGNTISFISLF